MFKEWEVLYPRANVLLRCHRKAKEERSLSSNARGGRKARRKSEVRSKSQTKEEPSFNCGGRKDSDSIAVFIGTIADHSRRWQQ